MLRLLALLMRSGLTGEAVLLAADALWLGIVSVHGAAVAIRAGYGANVFLVLLVGVLTGVGGGVLRDV